MDTRTWSRGDRVVHATKPEWGHGEVIVAQPSRHDGKACQNLTIRFDRAGTKTVSTAFASFRSVGEAGPPAAVSPIVERAATPAEENRPMPDALALAVSADDAVERLKSLPEDATDPFRPLTARLKATLDLYRFSDSGGSILDWAAAQTGLSDPLSRFSRHELERYFQDFRIAADNHLRKLVREVSRQDPAGLAAVATGVSGPAQQALRRAGGIR